MTGATVAIIVPAKNAEAVLAAALDSLLLQTRGDWEAIIVDDGSVDRTREVAESYAARDTRFRIIDGPSRGVAAARNTGIKAASAVWLVFLDADDWLAPTYLDVMLRALEAAAGADVAFCQDQRVAPDGSRLPPRWVPQVAQTPYAVFSRQCAVAIHAVVVARSAAAAIDGFDETLVTCEDWDFWQRIAHRGARFVPVPECLAFYRIHPESLSSDSAQVLRDASRVLERGAPAEGSALCLAFVTIWYAARDAAAGRDGIRLLATLPRIPDLHVHLWTVARAILEGAMVGSGLAPRGLAQRWPEMTARLSELIRTLGDAAPLPGLSVRLEYAIEHLLLWANDLGQTIQLGHMAGMRVDVRKLRNLKVAPGIDVLYLFLCHDEEVLAVAELPVFEQVPTVEMVELAVEKLSLADYLRRSGLTRDHAFWCRFAWRALLQSPRLAWHVAHSADQRQRSNGRALLRKVALESTLGLRTGRRDRAAGGGLRRAAAEARQRLGDQGAGAKRNGRAVAAPSNGAGAARTRKAFWDTFFEQVDPWNYSSPYEQIKYERTLSLIPAGRIGKALELACAEGHFTAQLAGRVEQLTATDISERALQRARTRCTNFANVSFRPFDLAVEPVPQGLDLIVCSEVLYFLKDEAELRAVAGRLASALAPGGMLVMAHAFLLKEDLGRTAFDWDHPYGAATITRVFRETAGLALEHSVVTELYRIDRFRRVAEAEATATPTEEHLPVGAALDPKVARFVVRGGAKARRADLKHTESTRQIPILMYHSVADQGPANLARYRVSVSRFEAQMRWLRSQGYHALNSEELLWHFRTGHPFAGRPLMLTFDDGFRNFHDHAWPILLECDFSAENFIVTDLVGGSAAWDGADGRQQPLMDWDEIKALSRSGARFGSHLATHRYADGLSSRELVEEAVRSRAALEDCLQSDVISLAAPFGSLDERFMRIAGASGYKLCFSTRPGVARIGDSPMNLPRIEVRGDWDVETFAQNMEAAR
jgi:peptidoglycan/xylan/chitin deacetylase (PgdA/CDA1 family)/predicted TPR repeat methyltransferase